MTFICLTIGCEKKDVTKESYGTFTYQAEGNQESIQIDKDTLKLSVDLEYLQNAKAGLELGKKKKELERENKTMTEKETSDYLEECRKNIDLS